MTPAGIWPHAVAALLLAGPAPAYVTEEGPPRRFEAELTLTLNTPKLAVQEWILYAPRPPEVPGQAVQSAGLQPRGKDDRELGPARRPVLKARVPATDAALQHTITARARYEVTLRERRLVEAGRAQQPAPGKPLTAAERKRALAATKQIDFRSPGFRAWLDEHKLRRREGEPEVDFGRRAFLAIVKEFTYDFRSEMDRRPDAVCKAGKSDCGGLSTVFVAALRANGIPARLRVGRWAKSQEKGDRLADTDYGQQHVIAEFFAPGAGWVAVDCASGVLHDRTPAKLDYFGRFRADFITFHVDNELVLDTAHFGKETVSWMQNIGYWMSGRGSLAGMQDRQEWRVRKLP
jgi:transglutaminase-like putative cysteine protease